MKLLIQLQYNHIICLYSEGKQIPYFKIFSYAKLLTRFIHSNTILNIYMASILYNIFSFHLRYDGIASNINTNITYSWNFLWSWLWCGKTHSSLIWNKIHVFGYAQSCVLFYFCKIFLSSLEQGALNLLYSGALENFLKYNNLR